MATIDLGKIKFTWTGAFATSTTYSADDVASHAGSSWVYVNAAAKTGTAAGAPSPSNSAHWNLMADGSNPMTTAGDMIFGGSSGNATRLPIGSVSNVLKVQDSTTVGWGTTSGLEGLKPLGTNIPLYAHTTDSDVTVKWPWLARYNGKSGASADYIPYDGMPNGSCGPIKRNKRYSRNVTTGDQLYFINQNHEIVHRGSSWNGGAGGTPDQINAYTSVYAPISTEFGGMATGEYFVRTWMRYKSHYAMTNKGNLWVWGDNAYGQLGLGDTVNRFQWVRNPYLGPDATNGSITCEVSGFACCGNETDSNSNYIQNFAIMHDGRVLAWGNNYQGSLGLGDTAVTTVPELISTLSGVDVISIEGGYSSTYFLDSAGAMWHTGENDSSIGKGVTRSSPVIMTGVDNVVQFASHFCDTYVSIIATQADGTSYGIGYNGYGQLGLGDTTERAAWTQTGGSLRFAAVYFDGTDSTTSAHALTGVPGDLFDTTTGTSVYGCGYNGYGSLGLNNTTSSTAWVQPSTVAWGTSYFKSVTTADGATASSSNMTFPRTSITHLFPTPSAEGTNCMTYVDTQGRMWLTGYKYVDYGYRNSSGTATVTLPYPYPSPWMHTLSSGKWYNGQAQVTIEDYYFESSHSTTTYNNLWLRTSDGNLWFMGDQVSAVGGGGGITGPRVHWVRVGV